MPDLRLLAQLDRVLAANGCTFAHGRLTLPVGAGTALITELVRIIVESPVTVAPAPPALRSVRTCRDCCLEIVLIKNPKTGKWMPADRRPLQIIARDGSVVRGPEAHAATCSGRAARLQREAQRAHLEIA